MKKNFSLKTTLSISAVMLISNLWATAAPSPGYNLDDGILETAKTQVFSTLPLSVDIKLKGVINSTYNVFVANQSKKSPWHWELFTAPNSGQVIAYLPGFTPEFIYANANILTGKPVRITLVLEEKQGKIYIDNTLCGETIFTKTPQAQAPLDETFSIGGSAYHQMSSLGEIYKLNIFQAAIKPTSQNDPSTTELPADLKLLSSWNFTDNSLPTFCSPNTKSLAFTKAKNSNFLPFAATKDFSAVRQEIAQVSRELDLKTIAKVDFRNDVINFWKFNLDSYGKVNYGKLRNSEWFDTDEKWQKKIIDQSYDHNANVLKEDKFPVFTVLRQTQAMLNDFKENASLDLAVLTAAQSDLDKLKQAATALMTAQPENLAEKLAVLYYASCGIRRELMLQNPQLDFDKLLFVSRGSFQGSVRSMPQTRDEIGGHFATQYFGFNTLPGGGLFVVQNWKDNDFKLINLLDNAVVENGRLQGKRLNKGAVCAPDLSFDGKQIVFSWTANQSNAINTFGRDTTWHIFSINTDGTNLRQLTDGEWDDFDACFLPNGRIAFVSERRGGYIRCFAGLNVRNHTMFSMKADGSDIVPISYFETSEWNPSVDNDGMLVFTRWDYVDRENCIGGRFWISGPDGSNPRTSHGNYPYPYHSFEGHKEDYMAKFPDVPYNGNGTRVGTPLVEMGIRSIPDSSLYVFTGAPHHGQLMGSLGILDLSVKDDDHMSQVRRLTPDEPYPESEMNMRGHYKYATPWPLSEDLFLANNWEDIIILDKFGNQELLIALNETEAEPDERFRLLDPIPLRPRPTPPIVPERTFAGEREAQKPKNATISIMNVYNTDLPLPEGTKIKYLRVTQNILKSNRDIGTPMIGYERENTPRIPLGIVPVEEDGSVYFEAPVAKELIFQILDENFCAVQSMRSVAFVFPGEQLSCLGCHEPKDQPPTMTNVPLAMQREPSKLMPELGKVEPISYYRQIKPILEKSCLPCHQSSGKGPQDMSYEALIDDTFWFSGGMSGNMVGSYSTTHGGSRTIPGRFGALNSKIGKTLLSPSHKDKISDEERHQIIMWLDSNSLRLGAFINESEQLKGELVWPTLDVDPSNVQGLERNDAKLQKNFWHENNYGPYNFLGSSHQLQKVYIMDKSGKIIWDFPAEAPQDVWMLPNKNVLVATLHAVREITPDKKVVWEYKVEAPNEIPNCQLLPNGNILVGVVGECKLIEFNAQREIIHELKLQTSATVPHEQFRMCRKTADNTYLVPFTTEGIVREIGSDGQVLHEFPPMDKPICAIRLPNGNTLISGGGTVREFTPDNKVVWQLSPKVELPNINIGILAGIQRLPNGNTLVCNWNSTANKKEDAVHIFEVTPDKRVVWKMDSPLLGRVAQCQVLDDNLNPRMDINLR